MDDLRSRISLAAQELFLRDGIDGVSMRRIADRVGVTAPAIYRHFRDKDELVAEIIAAGLRSLERYLEPALEGNDPYLRLRRLIDRYLDFALEQPSYFDFAFLVPGRSSRQIAEELEQHNRATFRLAVEQVATCMRRGIFREDDPLDTAILVWATVHGLITLHRMDRFGVGESGFREIYRRAVDRLLAGLEPSRQAPP